MRELIEHIRDTGCHCDAMVGWSCGIHRPVRELEYRIDGVVRILSDHLDNAAGDISWVLEALEILEWKQ